TTSLTFRRWVSRSPSPLALTALAVLGVKMLHPACAQPSATAASNRASTLGRTALIARSRTFSALVDSRFLRAIAIGNPDFLIHRRARYTRTNARFQRRLLHSRCQSSLALHRHTRLSQKVQTTFTKPSRNRGVGPHFARSS